MLNFIYFLGLILMSSQVHSNEECSINEIAQQFDTPVIVKIIDTSSEIEAMEMQLIYIEDGEQKKVPFGRIHKQWLKFKGDFQDGDCFMSFVTKKESWEKLHGRKGYLLVRKNKIISYILTSMS